MRYSLRIPVAVVGAWLVALLSTPAHAVLIDNGDGTVTQQRADGRTLMWLKDANTPRNSGYCDTVGPCSSPNPGAMLWNEANDWIAYLNSTRHLGYGDWRLPATPLFDPTCDTQVTSNGLNVSWGSGCTGNEMGYLYYVEFGRSAGHGNGWLPGVDTSPFVDLVSTARSYHSERYQYPGASNAWNFRPYDGSLSANPLDGGRWVWAVRTVVPEPAAVWLLAAGLALAPFAGQAGRRVNQRPISRA